MPSDPFQLSSIVTSQFSKKKFLEKVSGNSPDSCPESVPIWPIWYGLIDPDWENQEADSTAFYAFADAAFNAANADRCYLFPLLIMLKYWDKNWEYFYLNVTKNMVIRLKRFWEIIFQLTIMDLLKLIVWSVTLPNGTVKYPFGFWEKWLGPRELTVSLNI